jgi:hypothetical protein
MKDLLGTITGLVMAGFALIGVTALCGGFMVWAIKFFLDMVRSLG